MYVLSWHENLVFGILGVSRRFIYLVFGIRYLVFQIWSLIHLFGILEAVNFLHKLPICAESDIFLRYCAMDQEKNWYFDFQFGFWYFDFRARFIYLVFGIWKSADSFIWYLVLGLPNHYSFNKNTKFSCQDSIYNYVIDTNVPQHTSSHVVFLIYKSLTKSNTKYWIINWKC